ncbi:hypothetical protein V495_04034, partial [Pseudogymnoascus sp. VKM F-4514 (FW-929)]
MSSTRLILRRNGPGLHKLQLLRPLCPSTKPCSARNYAVVAAPPSTTTPSFTGSFPPHHPEGSGKDYKPPDERTIKLGK